MQAQSKPTPTQSEPTTKEDKLFVVSQALFDALVTQLTKAPFKEVYPLIQAINQVPSLDDVLEDMDTPKIITNSH